ncbi:TRAP transporter small permease [Treponema parvum]|uniref:TRAP transporter small permease n=1 Tax=Treponema parvum TaxID=138851 RepID=A0A975IEV0_9SPIR|nr:TRAP transporter small permease [Treponema parvum]QTQ14217.1 TRAP transporter small permease [Treponema parvum]
MYKKPLLINALKNLDTVIAALALVLLVAVTFVGVVMRYVFSSPFAWEEEVQLALIVWVVFFGGRYAFVTGSHPAIDMIVNVFPKKIRKPFMCAVILFSITVLLYAGLQGFRYTLQMLNNSRVTNILRIPFALIYAPLPIGCVLMSAQIVINNFCKKTGEE